MGIKIQKRIDLGKGFGLNISKSGIRPSYRTKMGSINTKGFSVRMGIPGITYKKAFSKSQKGCLVTLIFLLTISTFFIIQLSHGI